MNYTVNGYIIPSDQPIIFDVIHNTPDGGASQNYLDRRSYDERIYAPFYIDGDFVTFQFIGDEDATYRAIFYDTVDNVYGGASYDPVTSEGDQFAFMLPVHDILTERGEGCYIVIVQKMVDTGDGEVPVDQFQSQLFTITTNPTDNFTLLFKWNGNDTQFGFIYSNEFQFQMRLKALHWKPVYKIQEFSNVDSKKIKRILSASRDKNYEIYLDEVPEYVHDAMSIAIISDTFIISGYKDGVERTDLYQVDVKDYTPEWIRDSAFAEVKFQASIRASEKIRNNC